MRIMRDNCNSCDANGVTLMVLAHFLVTTGVGVGALVAGYKVIGPTRHVPAEKANIIDLCHYFALLLTWPSTLITTGIGARIAGHFKKPAAPAYVIGPFISQFLGLIVASQVKKHPKDETNFEHYKGIIYYSAGVAMLSAAAVALLALILAAKEAYMHIRRVPQVANAPFGVPTDDRQQPANPPDGDYGAHHTALAINANPSDPLSNAHKLEILDPSGKTFVPAHLICPGALALMTTPVRDTNHKQTVAQGEFGDRYESSWMERAVNACHGKNPFTGLPVGQLEVDTDRKKACDQFIEELEQKAALGATATRAQSQVMEAIDNDDRMLEPPGFLRF